MRGRLWRGRSTVARRSAHRQGRAREPARAGRMCSRLERVLARVPSPGSSGAASTARQGARDAGGGRRGRAERVCAATTHGGMSRARSSRVPRHGRLPSEVPRRRRDRRRQAGQAAPSRQRPGLRRQRMARRRGGGGDVRETGWKRTEAGGEEVGGDEVGGDEEGGDEVGGDEVDDENAAEAEGSSEAGNEPRQPLRGPRRRSSGAGDVGARAESLRPVAPAACIADFCMGLSLLVTAALAPVTAANDTVSDHASGASGHRPVAPRDGLPWRGCLVALIDHGPVTASDNASDHGQWPPPCNAKGRLALTRVSCSAH